jgi:hypothetical protein
MLLANFLYRAHLNPGETILYVAHPHPITIYKKFMSIVILGFLFPAFLYTLMPPLWIAWAIWAGIGVIKLILLWFDWYYDALLITNQSLVDLEWVGIFNRTSTRIEYHTIDGVAYEIVGFWGTILNYGDISIDRIGGKSAGVPSVSFPKAVEREILEAQNEFMRNKSFRDHHTLKDLLSSMMEDYSRK